MKRESHLNLTVVLAIALVIASIKLQRRTGVAAADWRKELLEQALDRLNRWSDAKIQRFMAEYYK